MKEFNSFDNYLRSLKKVEYLTAQEERRILKEAKSGDKKAEEKIIKANLRFVVFQAKKMVRRGCKADIEDLIAAGNMGLLKAISKFNLKKNNRFITFAFFWILSEMNDEAGMVHPIHLPRNFLIKLPKIREILAELPENLSQAEIHECIAREIGTTKKAVRSILETSAPVASLDASLAEYESDDAYSLIDDKSAVDPLDELIAREIDLNFRKVMDMLPEEESSVLVKHYGLKGSKPMSFDEIAKAWGKKITCEGVRQKEIKAMRMFREIENGRYFEGVFGKAV